MNINIAGLTIVYQLAKSKKTNKFVSYPVEFILKTSQTEVAIINANAWNKFQTMKMTVPILLPRLHIHCKKWCVHLHFKFNTVCC